MYDVSQIIIWVLWRLRPVLAVEMNLADIIATGFAMFADDDDLARMEDDPDHCALILAGIADANVKLDMLIYLRACEILGIRSRARDFKPNRTTTRSGRTPQECWSRFRRLALRFQDYERLAQRRAERLQRETVSPPYGGPLRLDATHQSTSPAFGGGGLCDLARSPPSRKARGRWIARPCAQDGGDCALARGPPPPLMSENQNPHLAGLTCENAPARPTQR